MPALLAELRRARRVEAAARAYVDDAIEHGLPLFDALIAALDEKRGRRVLEIKNRFTGKVLFRSETATTIAEALKEGIAAGANLEGANLEGANLEGANLEGADLARANLEDANLAGANLAGANLAGANLARAYLARAYFEDAYLEDAYLEDANLEGAYLAGANLAGAYLEDAYLAGAYLAGANLARAYLGDAYLAGANLAGANLARAYFDGAYLAGARSVPSGVTATDPPTPYVRSSAKTPEERARLRAESAARYRERHPEVPVVEDIDAKILATVESGKGELDMATWHTCQTTHCLAGWAIVLGGEKGRALEKQYGPAPAGAMIYRASTGRVPHLYASTDRALEDLKRRVAEAVGAIAPVAEPTS